MTQSERRTACRLSRPIVFAGDPGRVVTGMHYTHKELAQTEHALAAGPQSRGDAMEPDVPAALLDRLSRQGTRFTAAQLVGPGLVRAEPAPVAASGSAHRARGPIRA